MEEKHKVTKTNAEGNTLELSIDWDGDIGRWMGLFRVILYWLEFHPDTIEKYLGEGE